MTRHSLWRWLDRSGPLVGLIAVVLLFSLDAGVRSYFFSPDNARLILTQTVVVAVAAMGMTAIIISGGIDLSVGSVIALTGVTGAVLLRILEPWQVIPLMILAGAVVGAVNGLIITRFNLMPFIVTLGMLGIARGTAKWLADNQTVPIPDTWINGLAMALPPQDWMIFSPAVWVAIVLALGMGVVLQFTRFGRHVYAIGSNEQTARLCGVRVNGCRVAIYALGGAFFGLAGLFQLSRLNTGDPTIAVGLELDVIAAVVIGGASLSGGTGSIAGSMVGALIMTVLRNGSQQMGWPTYMQEIMIGAVIILAVALDRLRHRRAGG